MTDRPILFSGPMVRALLDGRKTQTRRIVKPMASQGFLTPELLARAPSASMQEGWAGFTHPKGGPLTSIRCPYGVPGDRLWVREAWCSADTPSGFAYCADTPSGSDQRRMGWRPSIHMPRAASRLTLVVTDVRVERLQDISEADAEAEGISIQAPPDKDGGRHFGVDGMQIDEKTAGRAFRTLWSGINGPDSWAANPWVWAVTFEVERAG